MSLKLIYLPKFIIPFQAVSFLYPLKTLENLMFLRFSGGVGNKYWREMVPISE